jgi:hypothetical protein
MCVTPNSIIWIVLVMEGQNVYCQVQMEYLNVMETNFSLEGRPLTQVVAGFSWLRQEFYPGQLY